MPRNLAQVFCILCFILTIYCGFYFTHAVTRTDKMRAIDITARNVLIAMLDAETGQRGYIITNDAGYLAPYFSGLSSIPLRMNDLRLSAQDTEQAHRVADIGSIINQKIDELDETVALRRTQGFDKAAAEIDSHLGKNLMDMIRQHLDEIQLWADHQYKVAEKEAVWYARIGFTAMVMTLATGLFAVFRGRP